MTVPSATSSVFLTKSCSVLFISANFNSQQKWITYIDNRGDSCSFNTGGTVYITITFENSSKLSINNSYTDSKSFSYIGF